MDKGVVVIGDCHGTFETLKALVSQIQTEFPDSPIVIAGDLVDRGPRSREVVQYVIDNNILCVKGNHEDMMCKDVLGKASPYEGEWFAYQGKETLESYKFDTPYIHLPVMKEHAEFLDSLPVYLEFKDLKNDNGDYLVVSHSAIQNYLDEKDTEKGKNEIMWNRDSHNKNLAHHQGIYNIHGHTPQQYSERIEKYYANIDTGACFKRPGYGVLTALHFPSMKVMKQLNID